VKIVKLGEVAELFNGSTPLKTNKNYWVNGDVPWFTVDDMRKQGKYITYTEKFITKLGLKESSISLIPENAVLLCCTASVGAIAINKIRLTTNQQFNALVVKNPEQLSVEYLYYWFLANMDTLKSLGRATTIDYVSMTKLRDMRLQLPSLEKQTEIVEKLDGAFAEIDLLEANLKLSEDKANQLLQSLLSAEYSLEGIPVVPLEKLVDILDNQRIPINSTERLQRLGNVPYYGATGQVGTIDKAIFNETLILLGEDGVPFFDSTKHKAYEISGPAWVNNHAHVLRAKSEMVNQRYLLHFLNIFNYGGYVNGATRLKLTQGDMKRIPVPHPNMETQEKIVLKIDKAFEVIKNLTEQINQKKDLASSLRHSLLSHALIQEEAVA